MVHLLTTSFLQTFAVFLLFIQADLVESHEQHMPDAPSCYGHLHAESGSLASTNYPGLYPNNVCCVWNISVPVGLITLDFVDFHLETSRKCMNDVLQFYDGASGYFLGQSCGKTPGATVSSYSNSIVIVFITDFTHRRSGWLLNWSSIDTCNQKAYCLCSKYATCTRTNHYPGYTCTCNEGYTGNGFECQAESAPNPWGGPASI